MAKNIKSLVIDTDIMTAMAVDVLPTMPAPEVASRMKSHLMSRIKTSNEHFRFLFAVQGEWRNLYQGVDIKVLRQEAESYSALIRMAADSVLPSHHHAYNEEVLVLEGEVMVEGVLCHEGDYHHALAGCTHRDVSTKNGCLLFVRNA